MPVVVIASHNVAEFPEGGGHFWVYLQYILGLRLLGCDVYWLEALRTNDQTGQENAGLATFRARTEAFGLGSKVIVYLAPTITASPELPAEYLGTSLSHAESVYKKADLLLNFDYTISPALLACFRRTALVDIDPGLLQFWIHQGQLSVPSHDLYFTIGEGISEGGDNNRHWIPIRPAVCLERWPYVFNPRSEAFTTVSIWDSSDWIVSREETYENTKRVAFLEFADLPHRTTQPLELALFLRTERDVAERNDLERLGWRIRHSREVAATPELYQGYIQRSRGEFSCAKPSYAKFQNAWISDRTICYLASGKPVVIQNTGPSSFLPNGEGMFRFSTFDQAVNAFETINADYERHCRAAREIAEVYFDSKQIAERILNSALS
jgi:hypothetical protein